SALEMQMLDISYKRIFVVGMIEAFQRIRNFKTVIDRDTAREILKTRTKELLKKEKEEVEREEF
ncbi:MAG: hypothetical protein K6T54_04800, partial [Ignavibacterium sp.]|nr:hypothetical protein [Ignavibacterium sp.]